MSEQEIYLQAKVQFLATQLSQAIDALCDARGAIAVLTAKLAELEKLANPVL